MGAIRKPRCQTGRLNVAECRDAQERRSDGDVEKAMDGFFQQPARLPRLRSEARRALTAGVAESPGVYVIGLPVLRRRKSSFIHGVEDDARDLHQHLTNYLDH